MSEVRNHVERPNVRARVAAVVRKHREELHEEGICCCGWHADIHADYPDHLAEEVWRAVTEPLGLTEEWAATCDQWNGGRMVRSTRHDAVADALAATKRDRGPYSCLEPPPPSPGDMRLESRLVSPWVVVEEQKK